VGSTQIILFLKMPKISKIIFLKEQIFVKKVEKSFQGILIFRNGIYIGHKNLCMNGYLIGDMNLVAMSTNTMWQLFHWVNFIF